MNCSGGFTESRPCPAVPANIVHRCFQDKNSSRVCQPVQRSTGLRAPSLCEAECESLHGVSTDGTRATWQYRVDCGTDGRHVTLPAFFVACEFCSGPLRYRDLAFSCAGRNDFATGMRRPSRRRTEADEILRTHIAGPSPGRALGSVTFRGTEH